MSHVRRGPKEKARRRAAAEERAATRTARTDQDQVSILLARGAKPGCRELKRLNARIIDTLGREAEVHVEKVEKKRRKKR